MTKKSHGELTAKSAFALSRDLESRGYDVLFDHSAANDRIGKIVSWYGSDYKSESRLSYLDIAVVAQSSEKVLALVEIEETNDRPKTLVADILATLLGSQITFQGKRVLRVGQWTTLIVMAKGSASHQGRNAFLESQVRRLQLAMSTANASIERVIIETFSTESELTRRLKQQIEKAIQVGNAVQ